VLEELSTTSMDTLFGAKDAETSILTKRVPLVLGSDINFSSAIKKRLSKNAPQNTLVWMKAAAELLAEQRRLLNEIFGDTFVILDRFDFGPQVLLASTQRQRTHSDGVSFFISGLLQFNVIVAVLQITKLLFYYL
jgi:hypothetical protein